MRITESRLSHVPVRLRYSAIQVIQSLIEIQLMFPYSSPKLFSRDQRFLMHAGGSVILYYEMVTNVRNVKNSTDEFKPPISHRITVRTAFACRKYHMNPPLVR